MESAEISVRVAGGHEQDTAIINSDAPIEANVAAFLGIQISIKHT